MSTDQRDAWGIPRRICIDKLTPVEKAIYDAVQAVEALPPDERLTNAVIALGKARDLVADFVDGVPLGEGYPRVSDETLRDLSKAAEDLAVIIRSDPHGYRSRPTIEVEAYERLVAALRPSPTSSPDTKEGP